jgi:hypothetical protein
MRYNIDKNRKIWYIYFDTVHLSEMPNSKDEALRSASHALDEASDQINRGAQLAFEKLKSLVDGVEDIGAATSSEDILSAASLYSQLCWASRNARNAANSCHSCLSPRDLEKV